MDEIYKYLENEENSIKEEIEDILRKMCFGMNYRTWSDEMIEKLYKHICFFIRNDLENLAVEKNEFERLTVTEEMVITAMMMCLDD